MNESDEPPPQATVEPRRRRRVSVVWIVPILAALIAIGIAVQRVLSQGPTIHIVFKEAAGLEAGKTFIKYKDVNIGQVTGVQLNDDFTKVVVTAKIAKSAAGLMVDDAQFWIVEPRISLSGVSGLGTLLSGNYIGFEAGKSTNEERDFKGLDVAPVVTGGQQGRQFVLRATSLGSLGVGAPVYYRSLVAGQIVGYKLAPDGNAIEVRVFVNAPYDRYVGPDTRFWNASGVNVALDANGLDVRLQSLAALIAGGVAFETPPFATSTDPVPADSVFMLYADQATAMMQPETLSTHYVLYFDESLRGLSVGAPVTLLGLPGGTVTDVGLDIDPQKLTVRGRVEVVAYPERLLDRMQRGSRDAQTAAAVVADPKARQAEIRRIFERNGIRAQLRTGNLLTGQLYVAFDFFPNEPKPTIDWSREPIELPVEKSALPELEERLGSILKKIDSIQYDKIDSELRGAIASFDRLLKDTNVAVKRFDADAMPEIKPALQAFKDASASATRLLDNADATLTKPDAVLQQDMRKALQEITRAARSLRVLTDYLEQHPEALIRGKTGENR